VQQKRVELGQKIGGRKRYVLWRQKEPGKCSHWAILIASAVFKCDGVVLGKIWGFWSFEIFGF
jgi:hypothetical protein